MLLLSIAATLASFKGFIHHLKNPEDYPQRILSFLMGIFFMSISIVLIGFLCAPIANK